MSNNCHGCCLNCGVIWAWPSGKHALRVTKGEAFCQVCGHELYRTAARLAKNIPIRNGQPIRSGPAEVLRARRSPPTPDPPQSS